MAEPPRSLQQRIADTRARLEADEDIWVASASPGGVPYMVPLSFWWDGTALIIANPAKSPTSRNLEATGRTRVGLGLTRDVVIIEATVVRVEPTTELGDSFAAKAGFDPRQDTEPYAYFRITPQRIQAWREANELTGRTLMRRGAWLG